MKPSSDITKRGSKKTKSSQNKIKASPEERSTLKSLIEKTKEQKRKCGEETTQWLLQHYETADDESVPRASLYTNYSQHCSDINIDVLTNAIFGKLIRSVFRQVKTTRPGTRGNSTYHYLGIRVKPDSPLAQIHNSDHELNCLNEPQCST